jgi:hypothetical protein
LKKKIQSAIFQGLFDTRDALITKETIISFGEVLPAKKMKARMRKEFVESFTITGRFGIYF